jgi:hypothetical protein
MEALGGLGNNNYTNGSLLHLTVDKFVVNSKLIDLKKCRLLNICSNNGTNAPNTPKRARFDYLKFRVLACRVNRNEAV